MVARLANLERDYPQLVAGKESFMDVAIIGGHGKIALQLTRL